MAASNSARIQLFSTDLDGTLLGNPEATQRFMAAWSTLSPEDRPLLVFNSGRLVADMQNLVRDGQLPTPDYYIGGVGTETFDTSRDAMLTDWHTELDRDWDRDRVQHALRGLDDLSPQPDHFQNAHKSS
jgi:sucrose-6-phosphatase